jgi:hypothetical protein
MHSVVKVAAQVNCIVHQLKLGLLLQQYETSIG